MEASHLGDANYFHIMFLIVKGTTFLPRPQICDIKIGEFLSKLGKIIEFKA
jgi:hypothetical protein